LDVSPHQANEMLYRRAPHIRDIVPELLDTFYKNWIHEEPVVEKRARQVEEVVVHRDANERVETVRDSVRETKVDVDKEPREARVDVGGMVPPTHKP
jgi:hypothetical protein